MRERFYTVRGLKLCVCEWGPEAGPVVLCLHGWLDQGATFAALAEPLAERGYRVLAPDARGHGRSEHIEAGAYYHFTDYVVDVDGLWRALGGAPLFLLGHSMGGTVACLFASVRPEAVKSLTVIEGLGPPALPDDATVARLRMHLEHLASPPAHRPHASLEAAAERIRNAVPSLGTERALLLAERVTTPHEGGVLWRWDVLHRTRSPLTFVPRRFLYHLEAIEAPVLLIYGKDSHFRFPDLGEREAALGKVWQRAELPGGHHVHVDAPAPTADLVVQFIESQRELPSQNTD